MKFRQLSLSLGLAAVAALTLAAVACGDDDSSSSSPGSGSSNNSAGTGSDEQYVSTVCKAYVTFEDSMTKATSDSSKVTNPADIIKLLSGPLDKLLADMRTAKPPKDVKDYHDKAVKALQDANDAMKSKQDPSAFQNLGQIPDPPADVQARLKAAAAKNADCQKAKVFD